MSKSQWHRTRAAAEKRCCERVATKQMHPVNRFRSTSGMQQGRTCAHHASLLDPSIFSTISSSSSSSSEVKSPVVVATSAKASASTSPLPTWLSSTTPTGTRRTTFKLKLVATGSDRRRKWPFTDWSRAGRSRQRCSTELLRSLAWSGR